MDDKRQETEPYYTDEEVIGSSSKYHRPFCPVIRNIYKTNRKRLQNWRVAVELGLTPCGLCGPCYVPQAVQAPKRIGF